MNHCNLSGELTVRAPGAPYSNKRLCLLELRSRLAADPRAQGAPIWMRALGDETTCPGRVQALELICRFTTGGPGFGSGPPFGTCAALSSPAGARPAAVHVAQNQSPYTCKHMSCGRNIARQRIAHTLGLKGSERGIPMPLLCQSFPFQALCSSEAHRR
jgi:hypothetical protein